eukprot:1506501-Rhodomonas_salina.4
MTCRFYQLAWSMVLRLGSRSESSSKVFGYPRVSGLGSRVKGLGSRVKGRGSMAKSPRSWSRVQVYDLESLVLGLGSSVERQGSRVRI